MCGKMWQPESLCCFSRKTGSLLLGSFEAIGAIFGVIMGVSLVVSDWEQMSYICNHFRSSHYCHEATTHRHTGATVTIVYNLVKLVFACMLMHGVRKNDSCLMAPFLINNAILLVIHIIIAGAVSLLICILHVGLAVIFAYVYGALIFLWAYLLLTVRAHFYELKRNKAEEHHRLPEYCELEKDSLQRH